MMESNFYSDEFEDLIRGKTEQYKMYPSEKVWKGVHSSLHTKRRWFIMGMSLLVMGILFFAGKELISPANHASLAKKLPAAATTDISRNTIENGNIPAPVLRPFHTGSQLTAAGRQAKQPDDLNTTTEQTDQAYSGIGISISHLVISQPDLSEFLSHTVKLPSEAPSLPVIAAKMPLPGSAAAENGGGTDNAKDYEDAGSDRTDTRIGKATAPRGNKTTINPLAATRTVPEPAADHNSLSDSAGQAAKNRLNLSESIVDQQRVNWLADYAAYNLPAAAKKGRTLLQLYFSPTVNYRALSGGNFGAKSTIQNIPLSLVHIGDAKNYVDHNPSLGFEVGGMMQYRLTRNLTVKGGLQFSFSRYTIKAYASGNQQATVALNSYYGYYLDSLTAITNISNFGGKTQVSLNNDYYQLSAPVGFELRVMGNERLQLNLGATIQPTYLLNKNSYLLTTDYTNYIKEPSLMRRWNVNGGLEAFLSYKTRSGLRWQVGPEFRYQLLSTYDNQYPIHEHLKGYGIKIGIVKTLP